MSYHNERAGGNHPSAHYVGDLSEAQRAGHPTARPRPVARVLGDYAGIGNAEPRPRLVARVLGHYVDDGLGIDKVALSAAKAGITPTVVARLNADLARAIRPSWGAIDSAPSRAVLSAEMRSKLKNRPLDFLLDLFDPIEDIVVRAVAKVNRDTNKFTRNFFGTIVNMREVQPQDARLDAATKNFIRRLRAVEHYMVLTLLEPIRFPAALAGEMLAAGLDATQINTQSSTLAAVSVAELERTFGSLPIVTSLPAGVTKLVFTKFAGQNGVMTIDPKFQWGVYAKPDNRGAVRKLTGFVRSDTPLTNPLLRTEVRGLGAVAGEETAAVPAADVTAKALAITGVPWIDGMILGIGSFITATTGGVTVAAGEVMLANEAIKRASGGRLDLVGIGLDAAGFGIPGSNAAPPATVPSSIPVKVGRAGPGPSTQSDGGVAPPVASGVPPIVFVAGAAALVFLLLRSKKAR